MEPTVKCCQNLTLLSWRLQVASNFEDMKAETDRTRGIKLAKTEGAQYI